MKMITVVLIAAFLLNQMNAAAGVATELLFPSVRTGKLVIVKAEYGDLSSGAVNDVTKKVARMVKNNRLSVAANNDFGDPAEGVHKQLMVEYTIDGKPGTRTVKEGETLTLP